MIWEEEAVIQYIKELRGSEEKKLTWSVTNKKAGGEGVSSTSEDV